MNHDNTEYDNSLVSKMPSNFYRKYALLAASIMSIPLILGIVLLAMIFQNEYVSIVLVPPVLIGGPLVLYLIEYYNPCPNSVIFSENEMILLKGTRKTYVKYDDIVSLTSSKYAYDRYGRLYPRWIAGWKTGRFTRKISFMEDNILRLSEILDFKNISFKYDKHLKEIQAKPLFRPMGYKPDFKEMSEEHRLADNIEYDNSAVSKMPPEYYRGFVVVFAIISIPLIGLGLLTLTMSEGDPFLMVISFVLFGIVIFFIGFSKYVSIGPIRISFNDEGMVTIGKKKIKVPYTEIETISFSYYSFDREGKPCPRWNVHWKRGVFMRIIFLTEENATKLAARLNEKKISFVWDAHRKKDWEERISKMKF